MEKPGGAEGGQVLDRGPPAAGQSAGLLRRRQHDGLAVLGLRDAGREHPDALRFDYVDPYPL